MVKVKIHSMRTPKISLLRVFLLGAIAYVNLGDAYLRLGKSTEAKRVFEKYLEVAPTGRSASYAKEKLAGLAL